MNWETVIGLEIHVQLATKTKIFSGASTQVGDSANTNASAIDLGLPGTLPLVNKSAIDMAIKFGLAIGAEVNPVSVFERKNYFYPDLPKGYQTTQLDQPIVGKGIIDVPMPDGSTKQVRIHHAHLEEDAGKSVHDQFGNCSGIDLNRAGTPLIEIVTEPDMRTADEAVAFAKMLHSIVTSIGICDGDMSQGSMRFDVNISIRPVGQEALGTRTETKNLNSFRFMERAIELEVDRQIDLLEQGGDVVQETRLYNADQHRSRAMRSKEEANDYRYFPCPDLLPVVVSEAHIERLRYELPELPAEKLARYESLSIQTQLAEQIAGNKEISDYFDQALNAGCDPKQAANWVMGEISAKANSEATSFAKLPFSALWLHELLNALNSGEISSKIAKEVFEYSWNDQTPPTVVIDSKGLKQVSDSGELELIIDGVIEGAAQQVENYRNADDSKRPKMLGFFVGQVMKASQGKANPKQVNELLRKKLG